jgi:DeoR family ulaG and ulaABCDEF operon transcriptional repressor
MNDSPAIIRRDLVASSDAGVVTRTQGGPQAPESSRVAALSKGGFPADLSGAPLEDNKQLHRRQKEWIGREAAKLCSPGEAVMIDGGSTTLHMCVHLAGLNLQVLTNSLHVLDALLPQPGTRVLVPGGQVFAEQHIILSAALDDDMPRFHAPKLFIGAAAIGPDGLVQADFILMAAKRRLIDRAEQIVVLADSSKFDGSSGQVVCGLEEIDILITDAGVSPANAKMLQRHGVRLIIAREIGAIDQK